MQDYVYPVGHTQPTYEMSPGFEPFKEKTDVGHFWDLKVKTEIVHFDILFNHCIRLKNE